MSRDTKEGGDVKASGGDRNKERDDSEETTEGLNVRRGGDDVEMVADGDGESAVIR